MINGSIYFLRDGLERRTGRALTGVRAGLVFVRLVGGAVVAFFFFLIRAAIIQAFLASSFLIMFFS